jgi:hypothetical protein
MRHMLLMISSEALDERHQDLIRDLGEQLIGRR